MKYRRNPQKVKKPMLPYIIQRTSPWAGMENLFLIGFISYMGLEFSTNAKFVAIIAIGVEGPSKCISKSGGTTME